MTTRIFRSSMNPLSHLVIASVCAILSAVLEQTERTYWNRDPAMLRASGFFIGLAAAFVGLAIF